jgi:putative transposase
MTRQAYPTDLTNKEWLKIKDYFDVSYDKGGRPPKYDKKEILNAIFYILRTGCQWRYLPHDFPCWTTIYKQFQRWRKKNIFEKINYHLTKEIRIKIGRNANPSVSIVDSQSVKTTEKGGLKVMMAVKR